MSEMDNGGIPGLDRERNFVITIGRQFGSGGRELGRRMAERFGIAYYDKELLAEAARRAGIATELFERNDEKIPNLMGGSIGFGMGYNPIPWYNGQLMTADSVNSTLNDLIHSLADDAPCVIVGRSADYVLRDHPVAKVSLFVHAPMECRVSRILRRADKSREAEAKQLAEKTDKLRAAYYNFYTDNRWGDAATYDLTFDSSLMEIDDIVDLVAFYIRRRFGIEPVR